VIMTDRRSTTLDDSSCTVASARASFSCSHSWRSRRSVCDCPPSGPGSERSIPALPASTNRSRQLPTVAPTATAWPRCCLWPAPPPLEPAARQGAELRQHDHLLAPPGRVGPRRGVRAAPGGAAGRAGRGRPPRPGAGLGRLRQRRQGLRLPTLPRGAATPWDHPPPHRPAPRGVLVAAWPPPLADRADDRLAARRSCSTRSSSHPGDRSECPLTRTGMVQSAGARWCGR
jgi:hypothetical protein